MERVIFIVIILGLLTGLIIFLAVSIKKILEAAKEEARRRRKRSLMNLELELKYEGFKKLYSDLCQIDFEGVFAIHNSTWHRWYICASRAVFRDAMSVLEGRAGPAELHNDLRNRNHFSLRAVKLAVSEYHTLEALQMAMKEAYVDLGEGERIY